MIDPPLDSFIFRIHYILIVEFHNNLIYNGLVARAETGTTQETGPRQAGTRFIINAQF
jgi:hypothetical protein